MTRFVTFAAIAMLPLSAPAAFAGEIDLTLRDVLDKAAPGEKVSALVYVDDQVDLVTIQRDLEARQEPRAVRHEWVVRTLQDTAAVSQGGLREHLKGLLGEGRIDSYQPYWIVNAVRVIAAKDELEAIAERADVLRVYYDFEIESIKPVATGPAAGGAGAGGPEQGLIAVRAPEAWALGFTGQGVLVSSLDTGVEGTHPALASRWRGLDPAYAGHPEWAWFDPVTNTTFPQQFGSHGTHTMGTICGGAPGSQVGVAPDSEWIHAAVIDRVSIAQTVADAILSFQWIIDPDENPATVTDVPKVNSNSWGVTTGHGYPNCDQTFWTFLDACEAAGIVVTFAAGNEGFSGLRRPADRATDDYRTFSVAAVDGNAGGYPIASFSSRGPTFCTPGGGAAIKPDIAAPGVNVISSIPGGSYGSSSGTSMATPHIAGVVALVYSANPDLSVEQVKQIIYDTAADLGPPGQDNDFGWGIVDAYEAVSAAIATVNLSFNFPNGHPEFIDPNGTTVIPVVVSGQAVQPVPGSGQLYYSTDGSNYTQVSMTETSANHYDAEFPSFPCGSHVSYYFSAVAQGGKTVYSPFSAPGVVFSRDAWTGNAIYHFDDLETNQGWTTEIIGATSGQWERGVPIPSSTCSRGNPGTDGDGSGQCWLTHNSAANACDSDVDAGSVRLTSPVLDASANPEVELSYWRWYSNVVGASPNQDTMLVEISGNGGASWSTLEIVGPVNEAAGGWFFKSFLVADHVAPNNQLRLRFTASDTDPQSVVEAGIDGITLSALYCKEPACPYDLDGSGDVGINDLLDLLADWGSPYDINDLLDLLAAWGPC